MIHREIACFALPLLSSGYFATVDQGQVADANQLPQAQPFVAAARSYDGTAVPSAAGDTTYQAMPPQNYAPYGTRVPWYPEGAAPGVGPMAYTGYPVYPAYSAYTAPSIPGSYQPGVITYPAQNVGPYAAATATSAAAPASASIATSARLVAAVVTTAAPAVVPTAAAANQAAPAIAASIATVAPGVATAAAAPTVAAAGAAATPLPVSATAAYSPYYMPTNNPSYAVSSATVGHLRPALSMEGVSSGTATPVAPARVVSPEVAATQTPAVRNRASLSNVVGVELQSAADVAQATMEAKIAVEEGRAFSSSFPFQKSIVTPWELSTMAFKEQKPALAIIRTRHCPTCKVFVMNMNKHKEKMRSLLSKVIAVDISDDRGIDQSVWVANRGYNENYVPRVYMLDRNGDVLDIFAPRTDEFPYSYWTASQIQENMNYILGENSTVFTGYNQTEEE